MRVISSTSAAELALATLAVLILAGCSKPPAPDAYGNIEATEEVVVGAQTTGLLETFTPAEGNRIPAGALVAIVDTTALSLQRRQIIAQRAGGSAQVGQIEQQVKALESQRDAAQSAQAALVAQRDIAQRNYERTKRLIAQQAATAQQLDQAERDYRVLDDQVKGQNQQIDAANQQVQAARSQTQAAGSDVASTDARVAQLDDQIHKSKITNPLLGTVLTTYVKPGEMVQPGQSLYKVANLDTVELRAYVTEPQLAHVKIGQSAQISVDVGSDKRQTISGTVDWIASEAEFTPTPIETRDERANLVFAVKIRIVNTNGVLKIGMPADVRFSATAP